MRLCELRSAPQLVYALGQLGYDFGTEARRDAFLQSMDPPADGGALNPYDPVQLLSYLENNPWEAAALNWTLNLDGTPIYAVVAQGPFASEAYQRLRRFLNEQLSEGVERVSIPGIITGKVRLLNGYVVPVISPEIRGMCSWTTAALIEQVVGGALPRTASAQEKEARGVREKAVGEFLDRVYFEMRNLGVTSKDRAMNYAGANAFNIEKVFESAIKEHMTLDLIEVEAQSGLPPGIGLLGREAAFLLRGTAGADGAEGLSLHDRRERRGAGYGRARAELVHPVSENVAGDSGSTRGDLAGWLCGLAPDRAEPRRATPSRPRRWPDRAVRGPCEGGRGWLARSAWPSACWAMARKARSAARLPGAAVVFCWSARKRVSTASPYLPARY